MRLRKVEGSWLKGGCERNNNTPDRALLNLAMGD